MKKKARIVKITPPVGDEFYEIQQRHWLFIWWWVPASSNSIFHVQDTFRTETAAKANLPQFDGTKSKIEIVN